MSPPRVSVALPVYNGAQTLPAALDSLLAQTCSDFEILLVDDGSSDDTPAVAAGYAAQDARVRFFRLERSGLVAALNLALSQARAPYVARMDADDLCLPERLAAQAAYLDEHPDIALVGCRVRFGGDPAAAGGYARHVAWTNTLLTPEEIDLNRFRESPFPHPSVMFRAETAARLGGYREGDFPEDYELWLRWLEAGARMAKTPEVLLVWSDPPDRLSRSDGRYAQERFFELKAGYLARWLARNNPLHPETLVAGAGRVTRKRADALLAHGVRITAYADIDPRKIGKRVHGRPVLHREELPEPGRCFVLSYVASHGAGEEVRGFLLGRGYVEGRHFLLCA